MVCRRAFDQWGRPDSNGRHCRFGVSCRVNSPAVLLMGATWGRRGLRRDRTCYGRDAYPGARRDIRPTSPEWLRPASLFTGMSSTATVPLPPGLAVSRVRLGASPGRICSTPGTSVATVTSRCSCFPDERGRVLAPDRMGVGRRQLLGTKKAASLGGRLVLSRLIPRWH